MIRPKDKSRALAVSLAMSKFCGTTPLPGVEKGEAKDSFIQQLIESERRVKFVRMLRARLPDPVRCDPQSPLFDPIRAAAIRQGTDIDEAGWLVFLGTHFGKNLNTGYELVRMVYGGGGKPWTWTRYRPAVFKSWLAKNQKKFRSLASFGNHRKYESLSATKPRGTAAVLESYWTLVRKLGGHAAMFRGALSARDPFDDLYRKLRSVMSFGRTASFDYLTMIGKLGIASIAPRRPYLVGATGPLRGARLMFGGAVVGQQALLLEPKVIALGVALGVGMQEMEDALCNWQKSPSKFVAYRG